MKRRIAYSDECRTKKYFQYAENMIPLFLAILKFWSYLKILLPFWVNISFSVLISTESRSDFAHHKKTALNKNGKSYATSNNLSFDS